MSSSLKFNWIGCFDRRSGAALAGILGRFFKRLIAALAIPAPGTEQLMRRIAIMERDIVLPIKAAAIAMLLHSFYFTPWIGRVSSALDVAVDSTQYFFWIYIAFNVVIGGLLLVMRRLPPALVQWSVYAMSLVDGIFLSALTLVTGGYDSILYWLFLALIVRSAFSAPRGTSQILLSLTLSVCYVFAGLIDIAVAENLDEPSRLSLRLSGPLDNPAEPLLLRVALLVLMTFCCYGVQVLLDRQRKAEEEAREFAVREGQLRAAGRLAAEFAHRMKNPLAIMNNALFSLQRALKGTKPDVSEPMRIIHEEIERSDRIITDIMGYAQLSEGRVEKVNVTEELDRAIEKAFPPGAHYKIKIHRNYLSAFPPLLMQRRHVADTFLNLLQNAREALDGQGGNIFVSAWCLNDDSVEVSIRNDGPGIPVEKQEKIFEAYYTTKEKGTGLGLAIVKHNVELYGGAVRLESELGKGTAFTLSFPARTLLKLASRIENGEP